MNANRFSGRCHACGQYVRPREGVLENVGGHRPVWRVWCLECFNRSDNSGPEDRCCGDRAYEDRCAAAVGSDDWGGAW